MIWGYQGSSFRHEEFVCPLRSSYYTTDIRKSVFLKFTTGPNALVIYHSPQLVPQHPQPHLSSPLALVSSHRSLPALLKKPYSFRMDVGLARREMRIGQKESKIISIAPRAKFSQREAEGKSVVNLTVNDIAELFVMRQSDAAKYLGISLTSLKSSCRMLGLARWPYSRKRKQISELCLTSDGKRHGVNQHAILSETESSEEDTESDYTMNALANSSGETNVPAQNLNRSSASFNYLKDDQEALFLEALQHVVEK
eukprot:767092-Hanusia_phi.AAC.5